MVTAENGMEVYTSQIEILFRKACEDNGALKKDADGHETADPVKATAAWKQVYNQLFKPDKDTILYNNKTSKLDYNDIYTLHEILDIFLELCMEYKIPPYLSDFSRLTGISRDTIYSWGNGEYRSGNPDSLFKHSDILKKINSTMGEMLEKRMWEEPIGRQSLANNSKSFGLLYNQQNIRDQAAAQLTVRSAKEIADRYKDALELPEMERPKL